MDQFDLDSRLCQALDQLGFKEPTPIQEAAIPLALKERKDIVARARTGSGKTAAYLIPIIEMLLLKHKSLPSSEQAEQQQSRGPEINALILVPSKELAAQVTQMTRDLTMYCSREITVANLAQAENETVQKSLIQGRPSVLVSTPKRVIPFLNELEIEFFVIDEADLVVSYGYTEDMDIIAKKLTNAATTSVQTFITSATLSSETDSLKAQFCKNVAVLKLQDTINKDQLLQYYVETDKEEDKFLLTYVIFKLKLIKGKTIIFVNDIDRCYRLKMFLMQFDIRSCVLNSELPIASRLRIVQQFNRDAYNLMIASDEGKAELIEEELRELDDMNDNDNNNNNSNSNSNNNDKKDTTKPATNTDDTSTRKENKKEYNMARGIDFVNVSCVVNFDLPKTVKQYIHRIGRTARANKTGMALSFVDKGNPKQEKVLEKIVKKTGGQNNNANIKPYAFDMKQIEGFRYRMEDAMRVVTKKSVRQLRLQEIKKELISSEKLKRHFEENPQDLANLRQSSKDVKIINKHLGNVPNYLVPQSRRIQDSNSRVQKDTSRAQQQAAGKKFTKRRDPLKSFHR